MDALMQSFKQMSPVKLAAIAGVAILLMGFFIFMATRVSKPSMSPLYSGLSMQDSAQIVEELEKTAVPYEIQAGGSMIMVPSDQMLRLRMKMAGEGIPSQGNMVGYEIFDKSDKLGTSSFVYNVNMLRAIEGELARTISSFQGVENTRVHLVLPKRELFSRERQRPSASVAITMRGSNELDKGQIEAVRHLIASAIPEMKASDVTVVDNRGHLLAKGGEDENSPGTMANTAEEFRVNYEKRVRDTLESLLERTIGMGKVRAEVNADIDFDRIVTNSEKFDPEGQVARSVQNSEEKENSREREQADNTTVGNQLPSAVPDQNKGTLNESNRSNLDEVTNYEISKVTENHIRETGNVKRLSVAILVDGIYSPDPKDPNGLPVYQPRSQQELDKIGSLVKSAVGFDTARGDKIEVVNMQFADSADSLKKTGPFDWLKEDLQGIIQTLVIGVVAILAILLIVRPVVNRVLEISQEQKEDEEEDITPEHLALAGPDYGALTDQRESSDDEMIDIDRIQGRVRSSTIKKVQDILENNPEEAMRALRNWMDEGKTPVV